MKQLEVAALADVLPAALISEVLQEAGKESERTRKLPASLVVWLVIGMGLYRSLSVENVLERITASLQWRPWGAAEAPCGTSLTSARDRLGWEAVRLLFQRFAAYLSTKFAAANHWLGHEVFTLDGTCCMVPDTTENERWFGRPRCHRGGKSGFPQLRALMLVGVWSHIVTHVVFGPYTVSEMQLADYMLAKLKPGAVLLLDRAYYGFRWASLFLRHQVHFVVRAKQGKNVYRVEKLRALGKNDWLCLARKPKHLSRDPGGLPSEMRVRIIECARPGFRPVFLMTDLLDPTKYPAEEIVRLYRNRWEAELAYREIKVHLAAKRVTFRCKRPERVLQEAYGLLLAYNCVRAVMCEAADLAEVLPTQLSFVDCLDRLRSAVEHHEAAASLTARLARRRLQKRRAGRTYVRAVKLKFTSHFPRKRSDRPIAGNPYTNRARQKASAPSPMT